MRYRHKATLQYIVAPLHLIPTPIKYCCNLIPTYMFGSNASDEQWMSGH